ncbi:unnamed protein product [Peniophora sp. CBMAI 1063]|nr:unnamed protein product [Peniophora sp. CBMAI 1063]
MAEQTYKEDPEYYITDQLDVFLVEDTLFRVHRSLLVQHSRVFKNLFVDGPPTPNGVGSSADGPIKLKCVPWKSKNAPLANVDACSAEPRFALDPEGWLAVLCVAHRYQCTGIHERALGYLNKGFNALYVKDELPQKPGTFDGISDSARILAAAEARGISVNYFVQGALRDIVMRKNSLSLAELKLLSLHLVMRLGNAREHRIWQGNGAQAKNSVMDARYELYVANVTWPKPAIDDPHFTLFQAMSEPGEE